MSSRARASAAHACALVIFGAGGDLTKRLLVPALYNLADAELLPEHFAVLGVARRTQPRKAGATIFMKC